MFGLLDVRRRGHRPTSKDDDRVVGSEMNFFLVPRLTCTCARALSLEHNAVNPDLPDTLIYS